MQNKQAVHIASSKAFATCGAHQRGLGLGGQAVLVRRQDGSGAVRWCTSSTAQDEEGSSKLLDCDMPAASAHGAMTYATQQHACVTAQDEQCGKHARQGPTASP